MYKIFGYTHYFTYLLKQNSIKVYNNFKKLNNFNKKWTDSGETMNIHGISLIKPLWTLLRSKLPMEPTRFETWKDNFQTHLSTLWTWSTSASSLTCRVTIMTNQSDHQASDRLMSQHCSSKTGI